MFILDVSVSSLHDNLKFIHSLVSGIFLIVAIWLIIRSVLGIINNRTYSKLDKILSYLFIIDLYLQLIFGIVLFNGLGSHGAYDYASGNDIIVSKRLWPIEHIVLMVFALLIANLGFIFSMKSNQDRDKYKKVLIYYCVAIAIITFSLISIYAF